MFTFLFGMCNFANAENSKSLDFELSAIKNQDSIQNPYELEILAYLNYKNGLFKIAENQAQEVLEHDGRHYYANFVMGSLYLNDYYQKEKFTLLLDAITSFKTALEYIPSSIEALKGLARCYIETNKIDKALKTLKALDELMPNNVEVNNLLGLVYTKKLEYIRAQKCLQKSASLKPDSETYFLLGNLYKKLGDVEKAMDSYSLVKSTSRFYENSQNCIEDLMEVY